MEHILITRGHYGDNQILGVLQVIKNNKVIFGCFSLELPFKNNHRNISSIPIGVYDAKKIIRPNGQEAIHILDVPNRSAILIHIGNFNSDIRGCVLVGSYLKDINKDGYLDVGASTVTMNKLLNILPDNFKIIIK